MENQNSVTTTYTPGDDIVLILLKIFPFAFSLVAAYYYFWVYKTISATCLDRLVYLYSPLVPFLFSLMSYIMVANDSTHCWSMEEIKETTWYIVKNACCWFDESLYHSGNSNGCRQEFPYGPDHPMSSLFFIMMRLISPYVLWLRFVSPSAPSFLGIPLPWPRRELVESTCDTLFDLIQLVKSRYMTQNMDLITPIILAQMGQARSRNEVFRKMSSCNSYLYSGMKIIFVVLLYFQTMKIYNLLAALEHEVHPKVSGNVGLNVAQKLWHHPEVYNFSTYCNMTVTPYQIEKNPIDDPNLTPNTTQEENWVPGKDVSQIRRCAWLLYGFFVKLYFVLWIVLLSLLMLAIYDTTMTVYSLFWTKPRQKFIGSLLLAYRKSHQVSFNNRALGRFMKHGEKSDIVLLLKFVKYEVGMIEAEDLCYRFFEEYEKNERLE